MRKVAGMAAAAILAVYTAVSAPGVVLRFDDAHSATRWRQLAAVFDAAGMCYRSIGDVVGGAWNAGKKFTE